MCPGRHVHRLRKGELSSNGHRIYGYDYVKKSPDAPAALVINEEQAAVVRSIFEMFASGQYGLVTITRFLEQSRISTQTGQSPTFCIPFSFFDDCLSLAPVVRAIVAGLAVSPWQGIDVHLHK